MQASQRFVLFTLAILATAGQATAEIGGHGKFNLSAGTYPDDSLFRDLLGSDTLDLQGEMRLNFLERSGQWTFDAAYQLVALQGDSVRLANDLSAGTGVFPQGLLDDSRRLFDLTAIIADSSDSAILHRLDRLSVGHTSETTVIRFGRQALSWGNGFFYAPLDLVNPFDPAAIDTEYKVGDDMLYLQYLRSNGEDVQGAAVFRRDPLSGNVDAGQATTAIKYHGFAADFEYDVLVAESYGHTVIGFGAGRAVGGAQWAADLAITATDIDTYAQLVTNMSYSWTLGGKNMSGVLEYHFNGFGLPAGRYGPEHLAGRVDLRDRLLRGESYTLGRHYLAGSVSIEMTPLWIVSPLLFTNIADPSALVQLTTNYSVSDNVTLLGSVNVPIGASGSEFGGIDSGVPNRFLSSGPSLFAQIAWYF